MTTQIEKQCATAVKTLIEWQGGSIAELGRVASVSRVAAYKWTQSGKVGEGAAVLLGSLPGAPLTAQQIRPDLDPEFDKAFLTKETKAAIKAQAAYIKERDKVRAAGVAQAAKAAAAVETKGRRRLAKRVKA